MSECEFQASCGILPVADVGRADALAMWDALRIHLSRGACSLTAPIVAGYGLIRHCHARVRSKRWTFFLLILEATHYTHISEHICLLCIGLKTLAHCLLALLQTDHLLTLTPSQAHSIYNGVQGQ